MSRLICFERFERSVDYGDLHSSQSYGSTVYSLLDGVMDWEEGKKDTERAKL